MMRVGGNGDGKAVSKRRPLCFTQKWEVSQYWLLQQPHLTRVGMVVLGRLLHRQNPKTGRCDPSAIGLIEETGYSERSVRGAFKELEERGAIKRYRKSNRARNQFLIYSVEELRQNKRLMEQRIWTGHKTVMQPVAECPAIRCRQTLQRPAPEKKKEKIKEKGDPGKDVKDGLIGNDKGLFKSGEEMGLGEFERRAVKVFEREDLGYEGLMLLPAQVVEDTYEQMTAGELSFPQAIGRLLKARRILSE